MSIATSEIVLRAAFVGPGQYTRVIYGYMAFAGFSIFFVLAGILLLQLLEAWNIAMDAFSYLFLLYNFAVSLSS